VPVLVSSGGDGLVGAALWSLVTTVVYGLLLLSTWYVCRALRPALSRISLIVATHAASALCWSGLWVIGGIALADALASTGLAPQLSRQVEVRTGELFGIGALFYIAAVTFHYSLMLAIDNRRALERQRVLALAAQEAELRALKAQVTPHFLFNSLNTISALVHTDPERARETCVSLAELLRRSLSLGAKTEVPLEKELQLVAAYLGVEKNRLGERLVVEEIVDESARGVLVLPLLLQPLVENAVRHGIARLSGGGCLRLEARLEGDALRIVVTNPFDPENPAPRGGLGLANVQERLLARYGDAARLEIRRSAAEFQVVLTVQRASRVDDATTKGET
jgi:two-component system, LytTR family, sensor histidine kinase AlgZ